MRTVSYFLLGFYVVSRVKAQNSSHFHSVEGGGIDSRPPPEESYIDYIRSSVHRKKGAQVPCVLATENRTHAHTRHSYCVGFVASERISIPIYIPRFPSPFPFPGMRTPPVRWPGWGTPTRSWMRYTRRARTSTTPRVPTTRSTTQTGRPLPGSSPNSACLPSPKKKGRSAISLESAQNRAEFLSRPLGLI